LSDLFINDADVRLSLTTSLPGRSHYYLTLLKGEGAGLGVTQCDERRETGCLFCHTAHITPSSHDVCCILPHIMQFAWQVFRPAHILTPDFKGEQLPKFFDLYALIQ